MMLVAHDRDLGEQLAQESFTRLFEHWAEIESEDHALRFAYRTALNLASSHHRRERRWRTLRAQLGDELARPSVPGPEAAVADRAEVFAAMRGLSAKQRECVVLVDYVGLDDDEAGATLGIAASTVRVHLTRGRRALRVALGASEEEVES